MQISKVAIVGAGVMGSGIAQIVSQAGIPVTLIDRDAAILDSAMQRIQAGLDSATEREILSSDEAAVAISLIDTEPDLESIGDIDLVIEAVPESLSLKGDVFRQLDEMTRPTTILASNTSSLSITSLASFTQRPEMVIGLHFFNPVPAMRLVEIVSGSRTGELVVESCVEFAERIGKTAVVVQDYPGFVSNRVLMPMINEAIFCLMEGVAGIEDIDAIMKLGMRHPMGPLELADLIGLDVCLDILEVLQHDSGDPKYRPCPMLRQMVSAGKLGRKTGEGFYAYE